MIDHKIPRWTHRAAGFVALCALLAGGAPTAAAAGGEGDGASSAVEIACGDHCQEALSLARRSTARYHDEARALADGFVADTICVALPGVGAMGYHYLDFSRMGGTAVDVRFPEILLYAPAASGERRLVGLEYFAPVFSGGAPWFGSALEPPPVVDNPPPVLFGQTFNGPMPGHAPGMPWHYDLHVWAWRHNPAGTFSQWNPEVGCD